MTGRAVLGPPISATVSPVGSKRFFGSSRPMILRSRDSTSVRSVDVRGGRNLSAFSVNAVTDRALHRTVENETSGGRGAFSESSSEHAVTQQRTQLSVIEVQRSRDPDVRTGERGGVVDAVALSARPTGRAQPGGHASAGGQLSD